MTRGKDPGGHSGLLKSIGPGILYAGAAIGASHLFWSTCAGALYGFALVGFVILAHLFKYPCFEFCRRYTVATNESALQGYLRVGRWALWTYLAICVFSGFVAMAALMAFSSALMDNLFPGLMSRLPQVQASPLFTGSVIAATVCVGLLVVGRYPGLDLVTKGVMAALALSTVAAFCAAVGHGSNAAAGFQRPPIWNASGIVFIIALMGWMPTPLDAAPWPSLWARERERQTNHRPTMQQALFDFHIGYVGSLLLALVFVGLGALVMYGTGEEPADKGTVFAAQFMALYTDSLGDWSKFLIGAAAFTCIFSTALTVFDGYARAIRDSLHLLLPASRDFDDSAFYRGLLAIFFCVSLLIIRYGMKSMGGLLLFATIVAFLTAPVLAYISHRAIGLENVPPEASPPRSLRFLSICAIAFLTGFALLYVCSEWFLSPDAS